MRWAIVALAILAVAALVWFRGLPAPTRPAAEASAPEPEAEATPVPEPAPAPERSIRGTVRLPGRDRAAWAIVHAAFRQGDREVAATAFAEEDGSYVLAIPADFLPEEARVWVDHPRSELPRNAFAFRGPLPEPLDLATSWVTISGRIVGDDGPLARATIEVHATRLDRDGVEMVALPAQTEGDGRFSLCVQRRPGIVLLFRGPNAAPERREVAPFDVDVGDIALRPGLTLRGRVAGDGLPAAGAWVVAELRGIELRAVGTDDDGWFAIPNMPKDATYRPGDERERPTAALATAAAR